MASIIGTVMLGAQTVSVVNRVGTDMLISVVTTTAGSVGKLITYITAMDHPGIDQIKNSIEEIDLEFFISVLDQLVSEQKGTHPPESVKKALLGVHGVMEEIQKELHAIKESLENHQSKYFASWRSFDCNYSVGSLKKHKDVLHQRYKVLTNLLTIYRQ